MMLIISYFIIGLLLSFLSYGLTMGYFNGEYPNQIHRPDAFFLAFVTFFFPFVIIIPIICSDFGRHGLDFTWNEET